jgi:hypothetical protein
VLLRYSRRTPASNFNLILAGLWRLRAPAPAWGLPAKKEGMRQEKLWNLCPTCKEACPTHVSPASDFGICTAGRTRWVSSRSGTRTGRGKMKEGGGKSADYCRRPACNALRSNAGRPQYLGWVGCLECNIM